MLSYNETAMIELVGINQMMWYQQDPQYDWLKQKTSFEEEEHWKISDTSIVRSVEVSPQIIIYNAPESHKNISRSKRYLLVERYKENVITCLTCQQVKVEHQ